jgi:MoaA/NifB/PqqE/SkfB family radical SAM enzyme
LHPQLDRLVDICKDYGLILKTSTNGILIKKHINLLKKFDYINVSLDAHDYESFKINRGGTPEQFDSIIHGLNLLKENGVYFSMSFLLSTQNMADANAMLAVAEKIGPNFVYFHNINPHGNTSIRPLTIHDKDTVFFLKNLVYKTDYPFDINMGVVFDTESVTFNQGKCIQPWYYFCFNSVGEVAYCCHLAHNKKIGNVFEGYDLNSPKMTSFRKNIIRGKFPKSCLYCQRRFMGKEYAAFSAKDHEWSILRKV